MELSPTDPMQRLIFLALEEDLQSGHSANWPKGDLTSTYFLPPDRCGRAIVVAREPCVLAGVDAARAVVNTVDSSIQSSWLAKEGDHLPAGAEILELAGPACSLLSMERTLLNFLQRLSGVATLTARFVAQLVGTPTKLLDTRKTTPGWRVLEKAAVLAGGGHNHRMGLFDMVLIKDNHLAALGDLTSLAVKLRDFRRQFPAIRIEIEADSISQVKEFSQLPEVDVILLDNMAPEEVRECLGFRRPGLSFEASGGISLQTARLYAETGVDYLSTGAITHSVPAVDLALDWKSS
jgi:nicotinate-nucleotide pyrophosphorylase (carboxylating)